MNAPICSGYINDAFSKPISAISGVPQETVLAGPSNVSSIVHQ